MKNVFKALVLFTLLNGISESVNAQAGAKIFNAIDKTNTGLSCAADVGGSAFIGASRSLPGALVAGGLAYKNSSSCQAWRGSDASGSSNSGGGGNIKSIEPPSTAKKTNKN